MSKLGKYLPPELTPEEFELFVKENLDSAGGGFSSYASTHREMIPGSDGEYEIDIAVRFSAFGSNFLCLIECKRHRRPVGREYVQTLHSKLESLGAQKGMIFSTSGFQDGAIAYAKAHGIALIWVADGRNMWLTRAVPKDDVIIPWDKVPEYVRRVVGVLIDGDHQSLVTPDHPEYLRQVLNA